MSISTTSLNMSNWAPYLSENSIKQICEFVEDTKAGVTRDQALFFLGAGGNGKSTLVDEITTYLGWENVTHISSWTRPVQLECSATKLYVVPEFNPEEFNPDFMSEVLSRRPIKVRPLYEDFKEVVLPGNILMCANTLSTNMALISQVQIIEFTHKF